MDNVKQLSCDYELNSSKRVLENLGVDASCGSDTVCVKQVAAAMSYMECLLEKQRALLQSAKDFGLDEMSMDERASWEAKTEVTINQASSLISKDVANNCCKPTMKLSSSEDNSNIVSLFN